MTTIPLASVPRVVLPGALERRLLFVAGAFILVNLAALAVVRGTLTLADIGIFVVWSGCAAAGHVLLERRLPQRDPLVFPLALFLSGWGLVLIDRLAPPFADRQVVWLVVAVGVLLAIAVSPDILRLLRAYRYSLLFVSIALLVSTIVLGRNPSGQIGAPELWLGIGGIFFQPSEILKVMLVAFLASYLAEQYPALRAGALETERRLVPWRIYGPIWLMWGVCVVILVWQRDLGTAMLFFLVFVLLLYVASANTAVLLGSLLVIIAAGVVAYTRFAIVRLRIDIWLNPWIEAEGRGFQIVQSLMAFAAGGTFGQGVGQGVPTAIPVVHSDFVFAAVAEEWGLLGVVTVVVALAMLVARGLRIALAQRSRPFHTLLAVGLSAIVGAQSLLIMGGVLKLIPLTGVTLPYLSYGGSSLLTMFIIAGLLLRLSAPDA